MVYLIKSGNYLKIGCTKNFTNRLKNYDTCNPDVEILGIRDGDFTDESTLHNLCSKYRFRDEWFVYNKELIKIFEEYNNSYNCKDVSFFNIGQPARVIYAAIIYVSKNKISLRELRSKTGYSIDTIRKSLTELIENKFINLDTSEKTSRVSVLKTYLDKPFIANIFSLTISNTSRAFLFSFKIKYKNITKVSISNQTLSKELGIPESTVSFCNRELMKTGLLKSEKNYEKEYIL